VSATSVSARVAPHHRPDSANVGKRDEQRRFAFHSPKQPHRLGFVLGGAHSLAGLRQQFRQVLVRIAVEQRQQPRRLSRREAPEVWRAIGKAEAAGLRPSARRRAGF